jgi:hypothetical protein
MKNKLIRFSVKLLGWALLAAGLAFGLVLCGVIARLITRAFLIGWRLSLILALALVIVPRANADTNGTPVYFSLRQLTGLPKTDRFMLIPDTRQNPVTDGTHLFGGFSLTIQTRGGQVTTNLQPIGYTLVVPGWSRTLHLVIPDTTNLVNAVNCITNGLGSYNAATVLGLQSVTTSNSTSVTFTGDGTSTNPLAATASVSLNNVVLTGSNYLGSKISSGAPLGINPQGQYSVAFGIFPDATGYAAFAMGEGTTASGTASHAVGKGTTASGTYSMAEGNLTAASGYAAHAEGDSTSASGAASSAGGSNAHADHDNTFVWADGTETHSTTNNEVTLYAANGYRLLGGPIEGRFTFTNAAGARFALIVNGTTNGFTFVPVP